MSGAKKVHLRTESLEEGEEQVVHGIIESSSTGSQ